MGYRVTFLHLFNGLFSRTTWASRYKKAKIRLELNEARDDGVFGRQWHQLDHMQMIWRHKMANTKSWTDRWCLLSSKPSQLVFVEVKHKLCHVGHVTHDQRLTGGFLVRLRQSQHHGSVPLSLFHECCSRCRFQPHQLRQHPGAVIF